MSLKHLLAVGAVGATVFVIACSGGIALGDADGGTSSGSSTTSSGGGTSSSSGTSGGGTGTKKDCTLPNACGPALGIPAQACPDGSIGGNTGHCINTSTGDCSWEIRQCPPGSPDAGPPAVACFDANGTLLPALRTCATVNDCAFVEFQSDCCGTVLTGGASKTSQTAAQSCGDVRAKGFPGCGCASRGKVGDDGSQEFSGATKRTASISCSTQGICETTFN